MKCIFCKENSDTSKSIEHILPESLGNKEHLLPKGFVCDKCSNYFATKIEKPLLEQDYFQNIRAEQGIESKKGRTVASIGYIVHADGGKIDVFREEGVLSISTENTKIINLLSEGLVNKSYITITDQPYPNNLPLSRLLGKMAIEALTHKFMEVLGWEEEIIFKRELDSLRNYVRYGPGKIKFWQYHQRPLYGADSDILHEYIVHHDETMGIFFIIAIFGIEYAINFAGPEIESYVELLRKNNWKSFLYGDNIKTE